MFDVLNPAIQHTTQQFHNDHESQKDNKGKSALKGSIHSLLMTTPVNIVKQYRLSNLSDYSQHFINRNYILYGTVIKDQWHKSFKIMLGVNI